MIKSTLKKIDNSTLSNLSSRYDVPIKLHKGTLTRACACSIATMHLLEKNGSANVADIDDLCYRSWGFPISHRKYNPMKTKGGLSEVKRVIRYLKGDNRFNPFSDTVDSLIDVSSEGVVFPCDSFSRALSAMKTEQARKQSYRVSRDKHVTRPKNARKNIVVKSDLKKISKMLANHIS